MAGEWRTATVTELQREGILLVEDGNHGEYRPRPNEFADDGAAFIRAADMDSGRVLFEAASKINERARQRITKGIGAPGDILLSHKGTVGKVAMVREDAPPFVCSPQTTFWRTLDPGILDRKYLYAFLRSPEFHRQLATRAGETDMAPYVSLTSQRGLSVTLPPIGAQHFIAHVLGTLDDKIELNRRMNETLEAMARALFKSWFVDFDPVRAKVEGRDPGLPEAVADLFPTSFEDSELEKIPKGWRTGSLGDEAARCGGVIQTGPFGSQLHAADYVAHGVPVVMPQDLSRRRVSTTKVSRVRIHDAERLSRHRMQHGDIVYSRRGDVERHALIGKREVGWLCGTGCLLVRLGPRWPSPLFASLALDLPETRAWIAQHAIGATMPNLNTGILARVRVLVPSDEVLEAFDDVARSFVDRIVVNDAVSESLASLRDALLPKLISGTLRVKEPANLVCAGA
jgi:type I restriction enzyme, S subunit